MSANLDVLTRVRATWALAAAQSDRTAHVFYGNLFALDETTKPLFVGNLESQGRKLTDTLTFIVDHLDEPDLLFPAAADLAKRHVAYGVTAPQYDSVGTALIDTLAELLGPHFTPEDRAAWAATYNVLATAMTKAAYPEA